MGVDGCEMIMEGKVLFAHSGSVRVVNSNNSSFGKIASVVPYSPSWSLIGCPSFPSISPFLSFAFHYFFIWQLKEEQSTQQKGTKVSVSTVGETTGVYYLVVSYMRWHLLGYGIAIALLNWCL